MLSRSRAEYSAPSVGVRRQLLPLSSQVPVFPCHLAVIIHYIRFVLLLTITSRQLGAGCDGNDQGRCCSCIHARVGLHEFGSLEESELDSVSSRTETVDRHHRGGERDDAIHLQHLPLDGLHLCTDRTCNSL